MTSTKLTVLMLSLSEHDFDKADCVDVERVDVVTFRLSVTAAKLKVLMLWCCHFQSKKPGTIKNKPKIVKGKKPSGSASKKSTKWWPHPLSPWLSCLTPLTFVWWKILVRLSASLPKRPLPHPHPPTPPTPHTHPSFDHFQVTLQSVLFVHSAFLVIMHPDCILFVFWWVSLLSGGWFRFCFVFVITACLETVIRLFGSSLDHSRHALLKEPCA